MAESISTSAYYPPRATGLRRFRSVWYHCRRSWHLDRLSSPRGIPIDGRLLVWLLLPGTHYLYQHKLVRGTSILTLWLLAMAFYWVEIGSPDSSTAFLVLCGLHSVSANAALISALPGLAPAQRLWRAGVSAFLIVFVGYTLFQEFLVKSVVATVHVEGVPVLVAPGVMDGSIKRGDWVAYRVPATDGIGFEQVLAVPGDIVRFHPDCIEVNGTYYQRTNRYLPKSGMMVINEDDYLIWPTRVTGRKVSEDALAAWSSNRSIVPRGEILGKAYKRWFGYRPGYPSLIPVTSPTPPLGKQP